MEKFIQNFLKIFLIIFVFVMVRLVTYNPFRDKSVIVVGNSPRILGKNLGQIIDSYDIVVRINKFKIDGYESDIGSKCNAIHVNESVHEKNFKKIFGNLSNVLWMGTRNRKKFCRKFGFFPWDHRIQEYDKTGKFTSGLLVILHILKMTGRPVHIVGIGGHSAPGYYYDQSEHTTDKIKHDMGKYHNFDKEQKLLKYLKNSGKIFDITHIHPISPGSRDAS
jgi:hypothetical protein